MRATSLVFVLLWTVGSNGLPLGDGDDEVDEQVLIRYTCPCGYTKPTLAGARILGTAIAVNQYSFLAGLVNLQNTGNTRNTIICGATIITQWHAITAASCTSGIAVANLNLDVGDHDWTSTTDTTAQSYVPIAQKLEHPNFNTASKLNDIALLTLGRAITFTAEIGPACMPAVNTSLDGLQVKSMGWGQNKITGNTFSTPSQADFTVLAPTACNTGLSGSGFTYVYASQLCLQSTVSTYGICDLDYGNPVVSLDSVSKRYNLVGLPIYVVQKTGKNCDTTKPSVATRIGNYLTWINNGITASSAPTAVQCRRIP